jgi:hypothetical protein
MCDLLRFVVVLLAGCAGMFFGAASWFLAGARWTGRTVEAYPTSGRIDLPSQQVIDAAIVTVLGTPVAAVAGAFAGVGLAEWLAQMWIRGRTRRFTFADHQIGMRLLHAAVATEVAFTPAEFDSCAVS